MPTVDDVVIKNPSEDESEEFKKWPIWTCEPSKFDWVYTQTETCLIMEGSVTVTDNPESGKSVSFGPGDLVIFPVGLKCFWDVKEPVRKHYNFS